MEVGEEGGFEGGYLALVMMRLCLDWEFETEGSCTCHIILCSWELALALLAKLWNIAIITATARVERTIGGA